MKKGKIVLITGPMFAGKTTKLLTIFRQKENSFLIKLSRDNRYSTNDIIVTHSLTDKPLQEICNISTNTLSDIDEKLLIGKQNIFIDEGQFFNDLIENVALWATQGKNIYISALNSTFEQKPFPIISELIPKVDKIIYKRSKCKCGSHASFTKRLIKINQLELIGGSEFYSAVCRSCF